MLSRTIPSPLGDLIAFADASHIHMLDFADSPSIDQKIESCIFSAFSLGTLDEDDEAKEEEKLLDQLEIELSEYFSGERWKFDLPLAPEGTDFQMEAWGWLCQIPYGETRSYGEQARMIDHPRAVRAIGDANNRNPLVILIPCHRVIGASWELVGYGWGIERKKWLLDHEKSHKK